MTFRNFTLNIICCFSFLAFASSQATLNLSNNKGENSFRFPGTVLSLDTSGLNLKFGNNMTVLMNESEQTLFAVKQFEDSIDEYESLKWAMSGLETIVYEYKVIFKEYRGTFSHGKISIDGILKDIFIFYLGNQDHVVSINGIYNSNLQSKYSEVFEKVIRSSYINENVQISFFEDLPFYMDENNFPYSKQYTEMPQSIVLVREVGGLKRKVTLSYFPYSQEEITLMIENKFEYDEYYQIGEKVILFDIYPDDHKILSGGYIILENKIITITCKSSSDDVSAIDEFREMAKSVEFRRK